MSAFPDTASARFRDLRDIEVDKIRRNPDNPRLVFPEEEIQKLAESIDNEGILVPVVVYQEADTYVLIDGERRYRCAEMLGLKVIPAVITEPTTARDNLVQMFNIHLVREPWRDMPTAWALKRLIASLEQEQSQPISDTQLSSLTGLSRERIARLRHALDLPREYQDYIHEGLIPLNWFWELKRNVVEPMARLRPNISSEFGENGILEAFVAKRLSGTITDTVSLRDVRPIINFAAKDAEDGTEAVLDETLRRLITDPDLTIEEAYEDTVQIMVEANKLQRSTDNMFKGFQRLLSRVRTPEERDYVTSIGKGFIRRLTEILQ